jgi:hypothetical protein
MRLRLAASAAVAAAVLAAAPSVAGNGFTASRDLIPIFGSLEPDAAGGLEAFLQVRGDGSIRQGLRVWIQGLSDATGATLWMANPGDVELEEVGEFAAYEGFGRFEVVNDTGRAAQDDLPLGAERMLNLLRAPVEVRVPGDDVEDEAILFGQIPEFKFRAIGGGKRKGLSSRKAPLRLPRDPFPVVDDAARGFVRLWRRRVQGEVVDQGFTAYATGLTEDAEYEIWVEDEVGDMQLAGECTSTAEGQAYFVVSDGAGDLPLELGDDLSLLPGRRVEFRRAGDEEFSLAGTCPRVR